MSRMSKLTLLGVWLALWLPFGSAAIAGNVVGATPFVPQELVAPQPALNIPNAATPYRFAPAPAPLSPLDQQKALNYRAQLQDQQRTLDALGVQGRLNPAQRQMQLDTQSELSRIDRMIGR